MPARSEIFVLEFFLGFGFLGGLLTHIGVNPEAEVFQNLVKVTIPGNGFLLFLVVIMVGIAITAIGILGTYADLGKMGFLIVVSAWASGLIILVGDVFTFFGAFFLIGAILLAPVIYEIRVD